MEETRQSIMQLGEKLEALIAELRDSGAHFFIVGRVVAPANIAEPITIFGGHAANLPAHYIPPALADINRFIASLATVRKDS